MAHLENHDIVFDGKGSRVARLADGSDSRSWYGRSRSRLATGLLLTSPGIPMLFMGEEFLEDKSWSDSNDALLIFWDGLKTDRVMQDYLRFCRELIGLRKHQPALSIRCGERLSRPRREPGRGLPALGGGSGARRGGRGHPG